MAMNQEITLTDTIRDCLSQQMSEFESLQSMYPLQGELILNDRDAINEILNFLSHNSEYIPNNLDFKLNLLINEIKLEIFINLPSSYPKREPDIYVRCNQLNRQTESKLNSELMNYIKEEFIGETCLYTAISWLQDNMEHFPLSTQESCTANSGNKPLIEDHQFSRLWVYSHHIYNKKKREEIVKKAKDLKLTGFSLPGKPGIICVEGPSDDCNEWWKYIKSMNWQALV